MDWAQILVIILSIFLALFLLLGILLLVLLIRLTQQIRTVTDSANRTANAIEHIVTNAVKLSSPGLVMKLFTRQMKRFTKKKKGE